MPPSDMLPTHSPELVKVWPLEHTEQSPTVSQSVQLLLRPLGPQQLPPLHTPLVQSPILVHTAPLALVADTTPAKLDANVRPIVADHSQDRRRDELRAPRGHNSPPARRTEATPTPPTATIDRTADQKRNPLVSTPFAAASTHTWPPPTTNRTTITDARRAPTPLA